MKSGMKMMAVNEMRRRRDSRGRYMEGGQGGQMEMGYSRMEGGGGQGNYNRQEGGGGRNRMEGGGGSGRMGDGGQMAMMDAPEMRRRRDSRGRYMEGSQGGQMEMGYSRMEGGGGRGNYNRLENAGNESVYPPWPEPHMPPYLDRQDTEDNMRPGRETRMGYDGDMRDRNVVNIRDYQDQRKIGFGANRMHHGGDHKSQGSQIGDVQTQGNYPMMEQLTEEIATAWVEDLQNTDPEHPKGQKWSRDTTKPLAMKHGFTTPEKQLEFWVIMNMMYSDYAETAKKHGVSTMDFYADMAKAWMKDKDAVEHKTAAYIACCTK